MSLWAVTPARQLLGRAEGEQEEHTKTWRGPVRTAVDSSWTGSESFLAGAAFLLRCARALGGIE